jgi:hypothetical protein
MKSKLMNILLGCCLASLFFACSSNEPKAKKEESCTTENIAKVNPNGDSELALLMRKMYVDADSLKQVIANNDGTISNEFIEELEHVHSAIPTDPNVKTPEFKAFNELLIQQAKNLQLTTENRVEGFNQLVNRCLDCHNSFCPGPMKKIKKLIIVNPTKNQ